jgi:NADH dehydrogenase/NADH:ubiquinone oxidoreductase subunit G
MRLLVKDGRVIGSLPDHANGTDMLCVKGRLGIPELVNHPTRLQRPVAVDHESRLPLTWEKAIEIAAEKISACDPETYGLMISADCSNETLYIARKFVREVLHSESIYLSSAAVYGRALPILQRLYRSSRPLSALSESDTILCLGFDGKYAQSMVETELYYAKQSGARLITLHTANHSLCRHADEWLQPAPGDEADLLEMLLEVIQTGDAQPGLWPLPPQAQRTAQLLLEAKRPVFLVGSSFLTHPDNAFLLKLLERLIAQIHAELILLPDPVNLGGAFRLGITTPVTRKILESLKVLHVVGEAVPSHLSLQPFILYQNMYPSADPFSSGLILPASTFTEEDGTFIDHSGKLRHAQGAVQAPGSALPSWQILCRIAQTLEVPGFDYESAAQIQAEMDTMNVAGAERAEAVPSLAQSDGFVFPPGYSDDHPYMGFPLRERVPGFRVLYPEPVLKIPG